MGRLRCTGPIACLDAPLQLLPAGVPDPPLGPLRGLVGFPEGDPPVQEEPQPGPHGVGPRLHHHELPLGQALELVRSQQGPLHHLEGPGAIPLSRAHRAGEDRPAAQGLGEGLRRLALGGEAAEDGVLDIIQDDLGPLLAVVLFQLGDALDDGHQGEPSGPAGGEEGQDVEGGHGSQLVAEEGHPVLQLPTVLVGHREELPAQVLDHQPSHEVLGGILLRQDEEDGGLSAGEGLGVHGAVKAQDLLQLGIQEGVEPGEDGGEDGGHGLLGGVKGGPSEPPGLVLQGKAAHEHLEAALALNLGGLQQVLDQLKDGDDVPPLPDRSAGLPGRQELGQQEDHGSEEPLRRVVKELVLPVAGVAAVWVDNGFGQDLGVLLRPGPCGQVVGLLSGLVHVAVDQGQEVIAVGAGGIPQVDDGHLVAVAVLGDGPVVSGQVPFGVQGQKAHAGGTSVL